MEECGPCPVFASFTLAFALQLREKARENLSQGKKNLSQVKKDHSQSTNLSQVKKDRSQSTNLSQVKKDRSQSTNLSQVKKDRSQSTNLSQCIEINLNLKFMKILSVGAGCSLRTNGQT